MQKLTEIFNKLNLETDKSQHGYLEIYDNIFENISNRHSVNFMEIGVYKGESLKLWGEYFGKDSKIIGLENYTHHKSYGDEVPGEFDNFFDQENIKVFDVDQSSETSIRHFIDDNNIKEEYFDIIIDDASHVSDDQHLCLDLFFDYIKPGGYFIIEDAHWSAQKMTKKLKRDGGTQHVPAIPFMYMCKLWNKDKIIKSSLIGEERCSYISENIDTWKNFSNNWHDYLGGSVLSVIRKKSV